VTKVKPPSTATLLCDHRLRHHLAPFLACENTLAGAAQMLRVSPQRMSYWIHKLLKAKLLKFVRYDQRSHHRSAVYRSVEDAYTVPLAQLDDADLQHLLASTQDLRFKQLQKSMLRNLMRAKDRLQLRLWHDGSGPFETVENPRDPDDHFGMASETYPLFLQPEELRQLHRDLRALLANYYALSDRSKPAPVVLYIGLTENPIWSTEL
jgi:hypothetical protein